MWRWCFFIAVVIPLPLAFAQLFTENEIKDMLDIHNSFRSTAYPTASNMLMMTWSSDLAKLAQKASDTCIDEHNYGPDYESLGENIFLGGNPDPKNAVFAWWLERENYNVSSSKCEPKNGKYPHYTDCGHYFQAASSNTFDIGCARQICPSQNNNYLIFCEYNNYGANPPYKTGPPCSACPSSVPFCYQRLCVTRKELQTYGAENVTCELICKNCGTKVSTSSSCTCSCPKGFKGFDCSAADSSTAKPNCSACVAAGTPCLNGAVESSVDGKCACRCIGEFSGLQCEINLSQMYDGLLMKFGGQTKAPRSAAFSYYPVEHSKWPKLWSAINQIIVTEVNRLCKLANYTSKCCPMTAADAINTKEMLLTDVNSLMTANTYPIVPITGELEAVIYVSVPKENKFCSSTSSWILNGDILLAAYDNIKTALSGPLKSCCGDTLMNIISASRAGIRPLPTLTTTQAIKLTNINGLPTVTTSSVNRSMLTPSMSQSSMKLCGYFHISSIVATLFFLLIIR